MHKKITATKAKLDKSMKSLLKADVKQDTKMKVCQSKKMPKKK